MAGRKQHYLPQHLLRGFAASKSGKATQVAVFKKGGTSYTTSTEGVAAERDFYSKPGDGVAQTLDDVITIFERTTFNPLIDRFRAASTSDRVDAESAASAVVHLTVRAAHLRGSFAHVAQALLKKFGEVLNDPRLVRAYLEVDSTNPESLLAKGVQEALDELPKGFATEKERSVLGAIMRFRVREKFDRQMAEATDLVADLLSKFETTLPDLAVQGHLRALEQSLVPESRVEGLKNMSWRVLTAEEPNHYILPDCAAIAFTASGEIVPSFVASSDETSWIAFPVSSTRLLVGYVDENPPALRDINVYFARCSLDYFVSSSTRPEVQSLAASIGKTQEHVSSVVVSDIFSESPKSASVDANVSAHVLRDICVNFRSSLEGELPIGESLKRIVEHHCGPRDIDRLESIVITDNIKNELAQLYGRSPSNYEVSSAVLGAVEVVPDHAPPQVRMLIPASIAALLASRDDESQRVASLMVGHLLGRLSYLDFWLGRVEPSSKEKFFKARHLACLAITRRFVSHYFGSVRMAGDAKDSEVLEGDDLSAHVLSTVLADIGVARQRFVHHRSVDALLAETLPSIDMLLGTLASYCGLHQIRDPHRALSLASPTFRRLEQDGLADWIHYFNDDLRRYEESHRSDVAPVDAVLALSEHVERILWQFGVFLSDMEDGRLWVDVCDDKWLSVWKEFWLQ